MQEGVTAVYIPEPEPGFVLYHYAVKKTGPYLEPACVSNRDELKHNPFQQGMTVNRGKVICGNCKHMMGGG